MRYSVIFWKIEGDTLTKELHSMYDRLEDAQLFVEMNDPEHDVNRGYFIEEYAK